MAAKRGPRRTTRIYYGTGDAPLFWIVRVSDAKESVAIDGNVWDALTGTPGQTVGCQLSNCVMRNRTVFPHDVFFASFTKRTCWLVDKITNGQPSHAVRYEHWYGSLVDLNDTDIKKAAVKMRPELAERQFVLRKPYKKNNKYGGSVPQGRTTNERVAIVPKGALARARKTGLITADLASQISSWSSDK